MIKKDVPIQRKNKEYDNIIIDRRQSKRLKQLDPINYNEDVILSKQTKSKHKLDTNISNSINNNDVIQLKKSIVQYDKDMYPIESEQLDDYEFQIFAILRLK